MKARILYAIVAGVMISSTQTALTESPVMKLVPLPDDPELREEVKTLLESDAI